MSIDSDSPIAATPRKRREPDQCRAHGTPRSTRSPAPPALSRAYPRRALPGPALRSLVAAFTLLLSIAAPATVFEEYQVKAVFLYNFVQFVEWPMDAFADADAPVVIGVLGADPFGADLDALVRDERVKDRPLLVRRYRSVEEVKECHLLFISRSESGRLEQILARLRGRPILTVNDSVGAARRGVMIRLLIVKSKVRLRINLEAARAAKLVISSKLLRPAEIVTGKEVI